MSTEEQSICVSLFLQRVAGVVHDGYVGATMTKRTSVRWRGVRGGAFSAAVTLAITAVPAHAQKTVFMDGTPASGADAISGQYICVFSEAAVPRGSVRSEASRVAGAQGGQVGWVYSHAVRGFSVQMAREGLARMLATNPQVQFCEQDRLARIPDPVEEAARPGKPGGGGSSGETIDPGVTRVGGPIDGSGTGRTAWVIDTGIDLDHPDLNVDTTRSRSFLSSTSSADDQNGHGTHVAGIIAAIKDNNIGTAGVAAGASVVSYRVLDRRGNGPDSGVLAALDAAYQNAAQGDVVNLSLITSKSEAMNAAVRALGERPVADGGGGPVHVVSAAGNNATLVDSYSPASACGANVYTAAAIDASSKWAFYSNYGAPIIDFAEPGSSILSLDKNGGTTTKTGTSMAAPHLSGILLLGDAPNTGGDVVDPQGMSEAVGVLATIGTVVELSLECSPSPPPT